MTRREISRLAIVDEVATEATVLTFTGQPVASGHGDMDLVCGHCGAVLVHGQTATDVALQYKVLQLVVRCECGRYNALSAPTKSLRERDKLISEAAYYRAERRGFASGHALEDWLAAEIEVDAELSSSKTAI